MRNSLKLGFVLGLAATSAFACSSGSDDPAGAAGSPGAGRAGAGVAGATAGAPAGGSGNGGSGANAGAAGARAGAGGTTSGGAGGASAGSGGRAGAGGASGGAGGAGGGATSGGAGGAGGASGGAGGASAGAGGSTAGAGGAPTCADESIGLSAAAGAGGATSAKTAVVLIDSVVVKKGAATAVEWQFANNTTILDAAAGDTPTADKWSRSNYGYTVSGNTGASNLFLACAGNPGAGSLKNIIPFTAADQQYEVRVPFAAADWSSAVVTANLKLVGGGRPDATCAVKAWIYAVNNEGGTQSEPNVVPLQVGKWSAASLTLPATGFTKVGLLGLRLTTFSCQ